MGEGNASVFDFGAIKRVLDSRGYSPIYETEAQRRERLTPKAPIGDCARCQDAQCPCDDSCGWLNG